MTFRDKLESFKQWVGTGTEEDTPRYGLLSSRSEWHAVGLGGAIGSIVAIVGPEMAGEVFIVFVSIALGMRQIDVGHLEDVQSEPAYSLVAAILAFGLTGLLL